MGVDPLEFRLERFRRPHIDGTEYAHATRLRHFDDNVATV